MEGPLLLGVDDHAKENNMHNLEVRMAALGAEPMSASHEPIPLGADLT